MGQSIKKQQLLDCKLKQDTEAKLQFHIKTLFQVVQVKDNYIIIKNRNSIAIWDFKDKKRKFIFYTLKLINSFCISYDNNFLFGLQKENSQLYIYKTKKLMKIIYLNNLKIQGNSKQIKVTHDNKIVIVTFYNLYILNFINQRLLICDFGSKSFCTSDYCPINNIVILPISGNILVWDLNNAEKIIQKDQEIIIHFQSCFTNFLIWKIIPIVFWIQFISFDDL